MKSEVDDYGGRFKVISNKLVAGRPRIHVFSEGLPGDGFVPAQPGLEDVFFAKINGVLS